MLIAIAACDESNVMGHEGRIPWHISEDFKHFQRTTAGHCVIMGRATWDSLPKKPLKGRRNIVLSRSANSISGAEVFSTLDSALEATSGQTAFVIGGSQVYSEALSRRLVDKLILSLVFDKHAGDTHFPMAEATYLSVRKLVDSYAQFQIWEYTRG